MSRHLLTLLSAAALCLAACGETSTPPGNGDAGPGTPDSGTPQEPQGSARIPAYDTTVGPTRDMITGIDGTQPGDPARAAAAILAALDAEETPLRLPLGADAVDGVLGHLDAVRSEVLAWEAVSRATAFEQEPAA